MGLVIYSANNDGSIFGFDAHDMHNLAPDHAERALRGEDPFVPNPSYVEGAGMSISEGSFLDILRVLGLNQELRSFEPTMVEDRCRQHVAYSEHFPPRDFHEKWMLDAVVKLGKLAEVGRAHGATEIVAH
jgi:hypothetical protein